jgi:molybdopterin converting factor small subunit
MEIKDGSIITPQDAINAYLKACPQYRAQLEPMFTAFMGAMQELNTTMNDNSDLPQSYQRFFQNYNELSEQISANPNSTENGPKIQAIVNEFKAIPESDSEIVANKFPFLKELILPSGAVYADFISILEDGAAKANGQKVDEKQMKEKAQRVFGYIISKLDQIFAYFKTEINNYEIPSEIANDKTVSKIAEEFGKTIENLSGQLFNLPWFNKAMNAMVNGNFDDLSQNAIAA